MPDPALEPFAALIGTWDTEATHPQFEGVVAGSVTFEWLEGGRFLIQRARNEHELFPDAICVIGAPETGDGLVMEYFDSRGVRRTYGASLEDGVLRLWRDEPGFEQRYAATLGADAFEGQWQLEGEDDLKVSYRRRPTLPGELFAGLRVRDLDAARPWYEQLLGEPSFFPNDDEVVWTLGDGQHVYIEVHAEAGHSAMTVFLEDFDGFLEAAAARGLEPDEVETYSNGVRKALFHDPNGNEVGFGGAPA